MSGADDFFNGEDAGASSLASRAAAAGSPRSLVSAAASLGTRGASPRAHVSHERPSRLGHEKMGERSWEELRELSSSLLLDESGVYDGEIANSCLGKSSFTGKSDLSHDDDAIDTWPLDSNQSQGSAVVRLHRSGSFTISSPRTGKQTSLVASVETEETKHRDGMASLEGVGSNWQSARTVTSLHRAYMRVVSEQHSLKAALHASERRCADLLRVSQDADAQNAENERMQALAKEDQSRALDAAQKRIAELEDELRAARSAKADLVRWKQEHLAVEQESLDALRGALDETSAEKADMAVSLEKAAAHRSEMEQSLTELRALSQSQLERMDRIRGSAPTLLQGSLRRWCRARMRAAWNSWSEHVALAQRRDQVERLAELALRRLRRRSLAKSVLTWRAAAQEARRCNNVRESILFRMHHRALATSVSAWKDHVGRQRIVRRVLRRVAALVLNRALARAFWTWQREAAQRSTLERISTLRVTHDAEMSRKHESMLALADKCVAQWQGDFLRLVLVQWRENAAAARSFRRRHFFMLWREKAMTQTRERRVMERAVSRILNRRIASAFASWNNNVQSRLAYKAKIGRFLGRMRNAQLSRLFMHWASFAQSSIEKKKRARAIMNLLRHDELAARFHAWASEVASRREARINDTNTLRREANLLAKYSARWRNRAVARVFSTWAEIASNRKFLRRFMQRMLRAILQKELFSAFSRWRSILHEDITMRLSRLESALAASQRELAVFREQAGAELVNLAARTSREREMHIAHVIGLMRNRQLARVFSRFKTNVQVLVHQRKVLGGFVEKWRNRRAFQALLAWRSLVSRRRFLRKILESALKSKAQVLMSSGFRVWHRYASAGHLIHELQEQVSELTAERDALSARYEADVHRFQAQRNDVCRRLAEKLSTASDAKILHKSFAALRANAERARHDRIILQRFSQRWRNQTASRAFAAWAARAQENKRNRNIVQRFVAQMQRGNLAAAFRAWRVAAQERRANRAKVLMFFRRQEQQTFWRCFEMWKRHARESALVKERAQRVLLALTRDNLQNRFDQWTLYVQDVKEAKEELYKSEQVVERVVGRMRKSAASRAFRTWYEYTSERRLRRERVVHFVQRWRMQSVARAFDAWLENARDRQRLRALTRKCLVRLDSKMLFAAFRKWASFAQRALAETMQAYADEVATLRAQLGQAEWDREAIEASLGDQVRVLVAHRDRIREKHADSVVWSWRNQLLLKVVQQWRTVAAETRRKRRLLAQFVTRSVNALKSRAFSGWAFCAQERKRRRQLVLRSVQKARERTLARSFASLSAAVSARKLREQAVERMVRTARRLLQHRLARAWRKWLLVCGNVAADALETYSASMSSMRDRCVHASIVTWQKMAMAKAFTAWRTNADGRKAQRRRVATFLYRWRNMRAAAAWRGWVSFCREQREKRDRIRALLLRWRKQSLALGLRTWIHATDMLLVIRLRESAEESLVLACWQKGRISTLSRAFRAWLRLAEVRLAKIRATKTLLASAKRMHERALLAAMNKWKQVTLTRYAEAYHLQERHGVMAAMQSGLVQIVCNAVIFPSLQAIGTDSLGEESQAHTTAILRNEPSLVDPSQRLVGGSFSACGMVWGAVMQAMGSASHHLFTSDSLQVFEVANDVLIQHDPQGSPARSFPAGSSLSAYTIRLGQTVAVADASLDARFNPEIDAPYLRMRAGLFPVSPGQAGVPGAIGMNVDYVNERGSTASRGAPRSSPFRPMSSPGSHSFAAGKGHDLPSAAFVCVPIFNQEEQVIGIIQASRTSRSCLGAEGCIPDEHYLDACIGVLSVAADSISVLLQWARALAHRQDQIECLRDEADGLKHDLLATQRAKSELKNHLDQMANESTFSTSHLAKRLRAAQRKIDQLQTRSASVARIESDVKRLLNEYDSVVERSATAPADRRDFTTSLPAASRETSSSRGHRTASATGRTDIELEQLEADQRALLESFPSLMH